MSALGVNGWPSDSNLWDLWTGYYLDAAGLTGSTRTARQEGASGMPCSASSRNPAPCLTAKPSATALTVAADSIDLKSPLQDGV
jgi:hypothetical protein